jgi:hypothetical protein
MATRDKEWTFAVDSKTTIVQSGRAVSVTDLKAGDRLIVNYAERDGKAVAEHVSVGSGRHGQKRGRAGAAKPPANPCAATKPANPCAAK